MIVKLTQTTGVANGWAETITGGKYDLSIFDIANESRIWRAKVDYDGGNMEMLTSAYSEAHAEKFVNQVIGSLKKNEMILELSPDK